jgi:hypothetical protein
VHALVARHLTAAAPPPGAAADPGHEAQGADL